MMINTDFSFGVPAVVLVLPVRNMLGQAFMEDFRVLKDGNKDKVEEVAKRIISTCRPELANGLILLGMNCNHMRSRWEFWVAHHSLPKVEQYNSKERVEYLEPCPACRKPIPVDDDGGLVGKVWMRQTRNRIETVCSEECTHMTNV